jgi:glycosyltransferase involved in cell wall biosynthesis
MRILAMSWRDLAHPQAGGSEVLVDKILVGLQDRGHDVALVCGGPAGDRPYPVHDVGGTYSQYLRAPILCGTRLRKCDLVIDVANGFPYFTPLWRRSPSVCLVHHIHTDQWETRFPPPLARAAALAERHLVPAVYRNHPFVAVSPSTAAALREMGVDQQRIRVVENGVDPVPGPVPAESPEPLFVTISRLVPHKRVGLLLEAWRQVQPVIGGRFVVVGGGPELAALRRVADGIPGAHIRGHIPHAEKQDLLGQAWFLVHGAHHEGWGMVILEAAAAGRPAIAADAPGVRDTIVDGETGILVSADDTALPPALAKAWIALAGNRALRLRMGAQARRRAAEFSWDETVRSWETVALETVAARGRR